jgi:hypothetical protein
VTYTAEDVKKMSVNEILELIERKTGKPVSSSTSLWLAMAHGVSKGGGSLHVCDLGRGETRDETLDYEALAELLNQPDVPKKPRPEFVLRIPKPDHFLETWEEAQKAGEETFERFKDDIVTLILWAMRDYRESLTITPDFCEHSFYWTMEQGGRVVFNGGLIKHGKGEDARWSIHT